MSTIDPDARRRALNLVLRPYALIAYALGILAGPVIAAINWAAGSPEDAYGIVILSFVLISVACFLLYYYVTPGNDPYVMAIFWLAYGGGLFLVMGSINPWDDRAALPSVFAIPVVLYGIAIVLAVFYFLGTTARAQTRIRGIDTTATVQSAPVNGMVNYVQHQHLTLTFTDNKGVKRWFRYGRTGGDYSPGDKIPIRYDPQRPSLKRAIIVGY